MGESKMILLEEATREQLLEQLSNNFTTHIFIGESPSSDGEVVNMSVEGDVLTDVLSLMNELQLKLFSQLSEQMTDIIDKYNENFGDDSDYGTKEDE